MSFDVRPTSPEAAAAAAPVPARRAAILQRWHGALLSDDQVGVFERNLETGEDRWDESLRRMLNWPADAPEADPVQREELIWPDDRAAWREAWRQSLESNGVSALVLRVMPRDRPPLWINVRWVIFERHGDTPRRAFGRVWPVDAPPAQHVHGDVDRLHLMLAAELAQVGLVHEDVASRRVHANVAARRIYGLPLDGDLLASDFGSRLDAETCAEVDRVRAQAVASGDTPLEPPYRIQHPTLGERHVLVRRRVRLRPDDARLEMFGAMVDVTETLQAQQRAAQAELERDQATALAAERMALLAAVSHEVRSPLNAILAAGEQLAALGLAADRRAKTWLGVLKEAGVHLFGLAEDLLHGASFEQRATSDVPPQVLSLESQLRRALLWQQRAAEAAQIGMVLDDSLQGVLVHAPAKPLRQVLLNLVGNAIKYNRRGGWVRFSARPTDDGMVELTIEDSGRGMSPEQQRRLFRPFDRLGREHESTEGFGLGLYLVQRLVRAMDGEIEVDSSEGQGTRVMLWLPGAGSAEELAQDRPMPSGFGGLDESPRGWHALGLLGGRELSVLAIDDDPLTPSLLRAQIESLGQAQFACVSSLEAALMTLQEAALPDLIMLDLNLGAHRGEEVLLLLREAGYHGPAVAFTGEADPVVHQHLMQAGFADVWTKPLTTAALSVGLARVVPMG